MPPTADNQAPVAAETPGSPSRATPLPAGDRAWVQLGISDSRSKLDKLWRGISARDGNAGLQPYLQPVTINGKPALRLLVGGYADIATATALLKRLRAAGIAGFVSRYSLPADPLYP